MSTFEFRSYAFYDVRLTARQAIRALFGRSVRLRGRQVQPLVGLGVGTSKVDVTVWGGGGNAAVDGREASGGNGRPNLFLGGGGAGGHTSFDGDEVRVWAGGGVGGSTAGYAGGGSSADPHLRVTDGGSSSRVVGVSGWGGGE
jgi:hypothetical protein